MKCIRNVYWKMIKEVGNPNNVKYGKTYELKEEFLRLGLVLEEASKELSIIIKNKPEVGIKQNKNNYTTSITHKTIKHYIIVRTEYEALIMRKYLEFISDRFKKPLPRYNNDLKHPMDRTYKWEMLKKEIINAVLIRTTWFQTKECFKKGTFVRFDINYEDHFDIVENRMYTMRFYNYREVPKDYCFYGATRTYTKRDYKYILKSRNIKHEENLSLVDFHKLIRESNPTTIIERWNKYKNNLCIEQLDEIFKEVSTLSILEIVKLNNIIEKQIREEYLLTIDSESESISDLNSTQFWYENNNNREKEDSDIGKGDYYWNFSDEEC